MIDAANDPYVLDGRVVTMGDLGVLERGSVYIRGGMIVEVLPDGDAAPAGFEDAERVAVGGTIYPGMIELHNHLSYNVLPLWSVPKRYAHNGSWRGSDEAKRAVSKPIQVLANTEGMVEAIVRYVECRSLLGGVTTSQGITLQSASGIVSFYDGLVRNVERPVDPRLPRAGTRIADPPTDPAQYLARLDGTVCLLQHLSEGFGPTPRQRFERLQFADGTWAINDKLCGIHSTALTREDFGVLAANGGSMVWSPFSNLLLYGETADMEAVKDAGLPLALGSDWAPSGSKNLLGELKVAKIVSDDLGGLFTDEELVTMVTSAPAAICKWDHLLGSLAKGKIADLFVVSGLTGDPFRQLVEARETSISLVVIDGVPRVGQVSKMQRFGGITETYRIDQSKRALNLSARGEDALDGITLAEAEERLRDGLRRLPELAEDLENALAVGFDPDRGAVGEWADIAIAPRLRIILDFEEDDTRLDESLALGAGDLSEWVESLELESIAVAGSKEFLESVVRQRNLPDSVKAKLPGFYGREIKIPPSVAFLEGPERFVPELLLTRELAGARELPGQLGKADRVRILEQAILLIEDYYVHLPMKRAMNGIDPVQRLRVLLHELNTCDPEAMEPELDFHLEVSGIFDSLRDLHTAYRLPRPYRGKMAWLPFLVEECVDDGQRKFLVSKVVGNAGPPEFEEGVEVLHWNGAPILNVVRRRSREFPAGNRAAREARGLNSLTLRSWSRGQIPDEDWVTLRYRALDGSIQEDTQPWLVFEPSAGQDRLTPHDLRVEGSAIGRDDHAEDLHEAKKALFASAAVLAERATPEGATPSVEVSDDAVLTEMPTIFRARSLPTGGGRECAYLRIFSFNVGSADRFVDEFERLLRALPKDGLILDIRGNGGGLIPAAERSLELLSPVPIAPQCGQFINTPMTRRLVMHHARSARFPGLALAPWSESMQRSVQSGSIHSLGRPLTAFSDCNARGQRYQGPVLLVVDGLVYSAADVFAAGFVDHGIGDILGVHENTGAGGANVWTHAMLRRLAPRDGSSQLAPLPLGADLRVAIRRMLRAGLHDGEILEDFGVPEGQRYAMTKNDILNGNADLIAEGLRRLAEKPVFRLTLEPGANGDLRVLTNAPTIVVSSNGRTVGTWEVPTGVASIARSALFFTPDAGEAVVEVVGWAGDRPCVRARHRLER